jgi:hypothetical protein
MELLLLPYTNREEVTASDVADEQGADRRVQTTGGLLRYSCRQTQNGRFCSGRLLPVTLDAIASAQIAE